MDQLVIYKIPSRNPWLRHLTLDRLVIAMLTLKLTLERFRNIYKFLLNIIKLNNFHVCQKRVICVKNKNEFFRPSKYESHAD